MLERPAGVPPWRPTPGTAPWSVGVEDEVLLFDPVTGRPSNTAEDLLAAAPRRLAGRLGTETHACVVELRTAPHDAVPALAGELDALRSELAALAGGHGIAVAGTGTHPVADADDVRLAHGPRPREVARTTRALAHRVPTLGLHVHVGVPTPDGAVRALDGLRDDLPVLLALSANSPFAAGRDTGFASYRTPLFSAFPRVGPTRPFGSWAGYAEAVAALVDGGAIADPSFLWWDVRLQPRHGTVEVRIADTQARVEDVAALVALVQCLVRLHAGGPVRRPLLPEVLAENRFVAARDGVRAELLDVAGRRRPVGAIALARVAVCRDAAVELGCLAELEHVMALAAEPGDARQRRIEEREGIAAVLPALAAAFAGAPHATAAA